MPYGTLHQDAFYKQRSSYLICETSLWSRQYQRSLRKWDVHSLRSRNPWLFFCKFIEVLATLDKDILYNIFYQLLIQHRKRQTWLVCGCIDLQIGWWLLLSPSLRLHPNYYFIKKYTSNSCKIVVINEIYLMQAITCMWN